MGSVLFIGRARTWLLIARSRRTVDLRIAMFARVDKSGRV
jgi:hypothetical protein